MKRDRWWACLLLLMLAIAFPLWASAQSGMNADNPPGQVTRPRVIAIDQPLQQGSVIEAEIEGLAAWAGSGGNTPWRLVPYINGRALAGLYPVAVNLQTGKVKFHLRITSDNRAAWSDLLSPPTFERSVGFSVGLEWQDPLDSLLNLGQTPARLVVIGLPWAVFSLVVALSCALSFVLLAAHTSILMDRVGCPGGPYLLRFSLAKVQLAMWFFVVFGAFLIVWLSTGDYNSINNSVIATLGISSGTALGEVYIKSAGSSKQGPTSDSPPQVMHGQELSLKRFVLDLITDNEGISIFRFQMLAWTLVLIGVFSADVYNDLVLPAFGPELLYLLGISSGAYVAHRLPEAGKGAPSANPGTPSSPASPTGTPTGPAGMNNPG